MFNIKRKIQEPILNHFNQNEEGRFFCELFVYGNKEIVFDFIKNNQQEDSIIDYKRLFTFSGLVYDFDYSEPLSKYKHWGCRYDATRPSKWTYDATTETEGEAHISFYTFDNIPTKWFDKVAELYPNLVLSLVWVNHFNKEAGQVLSKYGEISENIIDYDILTDKTADTIIEEKNKMAEIVKKLSPKKKEKFFSLNKGKHYEKSH